MQNSARPPIESSCSEFHSLLKDEYIAAQNWIAHFDNMKTSVKGWSVTVSMVGIGSAFVLQVPVIFLLSGASAVIFWMLEYKWSSYQQSFIERAQEIEEYFAGENRNIVLFQLGKRFRDVRESLTFAKRVNILLFTHIMVPHVIISIVGVFLYFLVQFKIILL